MRVSSAVLLSTRINTVQWGTLYSVWDSSDQSSQAHLTHNPFASFSKGRNYTCTSQLAHQWWFYFSYTTKKKMTWNETTCQKYKSKASVQAQCVLASYIEFTTNSFGNLGERSRNMTANTDNRWVQTRPVDMGKSLKILCHIFLV